MSDINLNELTVIELRKVAKEMKVSLGAGISKQGIIDKLTLAIAQQKAAQPEPAPEEAPAKPAPAAAPEDMTLHSSTPQFRQAYVAPQRFNNRPAYQAPAYGRQNAARPAGGADSPRPQNPRPAGYQTRFGPAAQPQQELPHEDDRIRTEPAARPAYNTGRSSYNDSSRFSQPEQPRQGYAQRPAYERPSYEQRRPAAQDQPRSASYEEAGSMTLRQQPIPALAEYRASYEEARPATEEAEQTPSENRPEGDETSPFTVNPSATELVAAVNCPDFTGVLEVLPEGYGFLRGMNMLSSARDAYVSIPHIRRFGLRPGDIVTGSLRPMRDGDKYPALLEVHQINGADAEKREARPSFDALTPIYPTRRIQLERKDGQQMNDLRLMDLITPIGFGQRGLLQCGPHTGKTRLLTRLANVISANHPDAQVMLLLFNETPENVTLIRESVKCTVYASTFDMAPEAHLRLADLVLERAERLVEMQKDVVLLADSLTTLIRIISSTAMQAGRVTPGMISPQSLQKAKRLFGAARCLREGGSLTVIATMNTDSGVKADDSVVGEFRGAANMELVLDQSLARSGVNPPFDIAKSGTKRAEAILTPEHQECIRLLRGMLGRLPVETAVKEINSMLEKAETNEDLISRVKVWAESMKG